jgi:predicted transcriptional regulator
VSLYGAVKNLILFKTLPMNITVNQVLLLYVIMMKSISNCRSILTELRIVMVVIYECRKNRSSNCNGVVMSIKQ